MLGCMDFGIHDRIANGCKVTTQMHEEITLIRRVNEYLNTITFRVGSGTHHGPVFMGPVVEATGMPGNFLIGVPEKIDIVQLFPELGLNRFTQSKESQMC